MERESRAEKAAYFFGAAGGFVGSVGLERAAGFLFGTWKKVIGTCTGSSLKSFHTSTA